VAVERSTSGGSNQHLAEALDSDREPPAMGAQLTQINWIIPTGAAT
jgi:hypothetical protein